MLGLRERTAKEKIDRGKPDEATHRELREAARQYDSGGAAWTKTEIVKGNFPAPYEDINGMTVAEVSNQYGTKVCNIVYHNRAGVTVEKLDRAVWEQMDEDHKYCSQMLFDPYAKEKITYGAFKRKYGPIVADCAEGGGNYDYLMQQEMRKRHEKFFKETNNKKIAALPPQLKANKKKEKKKLSKIEPIKPRTGDRFFLKINRGVIRNQEYRKVFKEKGYSVVYEYMWANIVRKGWKDKPGYPIKEKYYDNGLLAFCTSYRFLAKECGMDKNYVQKILDEFDKKGIVKLEMIVPEGKKRSQIVVVLGEWRSAGGAIEERLYRDQIFMPEAD